MVSIDLNTLFERPPEPVRGGGCGSCGNGEAGARCGNGLEKVYPTTCVRFGYMKHVGEFAYAPNMRFTCGAKVVVQTSRGLEMGEQVSLTCNGCDKSVTREQMRGYAEASGGDTVIFDAGRIVREATMADLAEYSRIQSMIPQRRRLAGDLARSLGLTMKVIECELLFGGERAVFYFSAEARVDFRQLVKDLSGEFQTRIEMRQIGARDEARLLADFETCGREVCCKVFLKNLKPISMKMAKLQKSTIDPTKVSGRCGRLKCCLRYEHTSYEELDRRLPRMGARISTRHGEGVVINRQILTQLIQIQKDDEGIVTVVVEDVLGPDSPAGPGKGRPEPADVGDAGGLGLEVPKTDTGSVDRDDGAPEDTDSAATPSRRPGPDRLSRLGEGRPGGQARRDRSNRPGPPDRRDRPDNRGQQSHRPPEITPDRTDRPGSPPSVDPRPAAPVDRSPSPSIGEGQAPSLDDGAPKIGMEPPTGVPDDGKTPSALGTMAENSDVPPRMTPDGQGPVERQDQKRPPPSPLHRRGKWKHRPRGRDGGS